MSFVRPEAARALRRWREAIVAGCVAALGIYWAFGSGILSWIGYALAGAGLGLGAAAVQRARFRTGGDGPGVVQVNERRLTHFGPLSGGMADLEEVTALRLDATARPPHWMLDTPGQPALAIPVNAEGAEALFDAFAALPGLDTGRLVQALQHPRDHAGVIWQRAGAQASVRRLH